MVLMPEPERTTATAIYESYEKLAEDWRRPHLGASVIGGECDRAAWLTFRWACRPDHEGRMLRLFGTGSREEPRIHADLRAIGCEVYAPDYPPEGVDPDSWRELFRMRLAPHFGGEADGVIRGIPEAPKTWHLLECKTANAKSFDKIAKEGCEKAKPVHYSQQQVYMRGLGLTRSLYFVVCKNDDRIYTERIRYDREVAERMVGKARRVFAQVSPPSRISDDPGWWQCRWCDHRPVCQSATQAPEINCRTCISATPRSDGTWFCEHRREVLDVDEQKAGCAEHVYIPGLLPWRVKTADSSKRAVVYESDGHGIVVNRGRQTGREIAALIEGP